jgi:hypothetical protein
MEKMTPAPDVVSNDDDDYAILLQVLLGKER